MGISHELQGMVLFEFILSSLSTFLVSFCLPTYLDPLFFVYPSTVIPGALCNREPYLSTSFYPVIAK
jgi:hypothetical protein